MAFKFETSKEDDEIWSQFCQSNNFFMKITQEDLQHQGSVLPEHLTLDYLTDITALKNCLNKSAFKLIHDRYRQFKRRATKKTTTLTLHRDTLARLKAYASHNGYYYDTIDELIEYLIDPEDRLEKSTPDNIPESSLSLTRQFAITRAKLALRPHSWRTVLNQIDMAFRAGWLACKYLNGAKRTEKALDEKSAEYLTDIQTSD